MSPLVSKFLFALVDPFLSQTQQFVEERCFPLQMEDRWDGFNSRQIIIGASGEFFCSILSTRFHGSLQLPVIYHNNLTIIKIPSTENRSHCFGL